MAIDEYSHHERREVGRVPVEGVVPPHRRRPVEGQAEVDRGDDHPHDRDRVEPPPVVAQVPGALLEGVALAPAQVDRHDVGDVEAEHADRDDREEGDRHAGGVTRQRGQRDDPREHARPDHRRDRHAALAVDAAPEPVAGRDAVARQREERARAARHACHAAEELPDRRDQDHELGPAAAHRALEDRQRGAAAVVDGADVRRRERDREQDEPADHAPTGPPTARRPSPPRSRRRGSPRRRAPRRRSR